MESTGRSATTRVPRGLAITGDLTSSEDVTIEGRLDGQVAVPDHHVEIAESAIVRAKIVARLVTIRGTLEGSVAADRVELMPSASVRAHLATPAIVLHDGATFTGTVDPARSEAAMHVAKYRQRQDNA